MARYDATRRHTPVKSKCGLPKHVLLVLIGFSCGYITATLFHWNEVMVWVNTHFLTQTSPQSTVSSKTHAEIPKPKFEFYTLLTQENRANAASEHIASLKEERPVTTASPSQASVSSQSLPTEIQLVAPQSHLALQEKKAIESTLAQAREGYWVQLASFRRAQDAEKMKANLSLKGVMTTVVTATQQHVQWFRVVLGPFPSKYDAERAKKSVMLTSRIQGIVRKMDV